MAPHTCNLRVQSFIADNLWGDEREWNHSNFLEQKESAKYC